jgi:hypothetical protein
MMDGLGRWMVLLSVVAGCHRGEGEACSYDWQCDSCLECAEAHSGSMECFPDSACLGSRSVEGLSCTAEEFCTQGTKKGLVCNNYSGKCATPGVAGTECYESPDCAASLVCDLGGEPPRCVNEQDLQRKKGGEPGQ